MNSVRMRRRRRGRGADLQRDVPVWIAPICWLTRLPIDPVIGVARAKCLVKVTIAGCGTRCGLAKHGYVPVAS